MNSETYDSLPADVKDRVANAVVINNLIPPGQVRMGGPGGTQVSVTDFVKATRRQVSKAERRARNKRERQNKRLGRR